MKRFKRYAQNKKPVNDLSGKKVYGAWQGEYAEDRELIGIFSSSVIASSKGEVEEYIIDGNLEREYRKVFIVQMNIDGVVFRKYDQLKRVHPNFLDGQTWNNNNKQIFHGESARSFEKAQEMAEDLRQQWLQSKP